MTAFAVSHDRDEQVDIDRMAMAPTHPLPYCLRRHIPRTNCVITDRIMLHEVQEELQRVSGEQLEIIYDVSTTNDAARPAHHVYRVKQRAGVPSEDQLVLEFSCQHDMNKGWSPDNARMPGWWIIEYFKSVDKARLPGTEEEINRRQVEAIHEHNAAVDREKQRKVDDAHRELKKDIRDYVIRGKNSLGERLRRKDKRRAGQSPKDAA